MDKAVFTFVVPTLTGGGAERVVSVLASALAELGYKTNIIVHYKTEETYPVSSRVNVYYDANKTDGNNSIVGKIRKLLRIRNQVRKTGTTYLIPFMDSCLIHSYYATWGMRTKLISTIRVNPRCRTSGLGEKCDEIVAKSNALFAQTLDEKEYYPEAIQKKTFVLPNPVNPEAFEKKHAYGEQIKNIVMAGRFTEQKNYPMALRCACIMRDRGYELTFRLYGEGKNTQDIREMITEMQLEDTVYLMGRSSTMLDDFNSSDIYVMTSNFEGMPNTLMEAMAVGLPCISTDCPSGPSDLIVNRDNGILIQMNNEVQMADELERLIKSPQMAKELGCKARESIRARYSPDIIAKRFVDECLKY